MKMATLATLKKVLEVLEKNGVNLPDSFFAAEHDVLYIYDGAGDVSFADELEAAGAHYNESDSWILFC